MSPAAVGARSSMDMDQPSPVPATAASPDGLAALATLNARPAPAPKRRPDGTLLLTEENSYEALGFAFPSWKKWFILTTIFIVQLSMNWNAAIYGNAIPGLKVPGRLILRDRDASDCGRVAGYL